MSKISDLNLMNQGDIASTADYIPILDSSQNVVKKISPYVLQGYTLNVSPNANITSLCTSDYTVTNCTARVISGHAMFVYATISNGTTGIPLQVQNVQTENIITLPSNYFVSIVNFGLLTRVLSEVPPTAYYSYPISIPIYSNVLTISRSAGPTWNSNLFPSNCITANNGLKGLAVAMLALTKYDINELPYDN